MSLEENKVKVRKVIESINEQNLDFLDNLTAPDYFDHTHQLNPDGVKQFMNMIFKAFPDWHETIEDIIAEGDKVWVRFTGRGTHRGEWCGLAPTGKKITFTGVQIWRIVDGKVIEKKSISDILDACKQLGIIEFTEKAKEFFSAIHMSIE